MLSRHGDGSEVKANRMEINKALAARVAGAFLLATLLALLSTACSWTKVHGAPVPRGRKTKNQVPIS